MPLNVDCRQHNLLTTRCCDARIESILLDVNAIKRTVFVVIITLIDQALNDGLQLQTRRHTRLSSIFKTTEEREMGRSMYNSVKRGKEKARQQKQMDKAAKRPRCPDTFRHSRENAFQSTGGACWRLRTP